MDITVPDIGHFIDVPVIEVHVTAGDVVAAEDPLITLESDKATLDVPASAAGTVSEVAVRVGDQVSAGDLILRLDAASAPSGPAATPVRERVTEDAAPAPAEPPGYGSPSGIYEVIEVTVPDIGHFIEVPVVEVHVAAGDAIAPEDPLITLESDKATLDIPAPMAGTIIAVRVAVGNHVSAGHVIADLRTGQHPVPEAAQPTPEAVAAESRPAAAARTTAGPARRPATKPGPVISPRTYSSSAPGRAATRPRSGPPTWVRRSCSWTAGRPSAESASTSAASRPRPCCTPPRSSPRPRR